jgi:hypothetical protein
MADNTAYAMSWLLKHGYTQPQAAAMVGHATQESGIRTDATGDNGTAKGVFQWRGDRLAGLKSFAQATGQDANSLDTQLGYMDHELNTTERKAGDALRAATTVRDATRAGMMFERPQGYTADNPEAGHGWANRYGEAMRLAGQTIDPSAVASAPTAPATPGLGPGMLQPPGLMASAFIPQPVVIDEGIAQRRAQAAVQEQEARKALLGGGGLAQLFG